MKIISWNCNGAFRKKYYLLDKFNADIYIIQECEDPKQSTRKFQEWAGTNYLWRGKSKNKGIGIFARSKITLEELDWPSDILELFLSFKINETPLVAVWTKQANSPTFGYIGQLWKYIRLNEALFQKEKPILIGDFNSNSIWDKWDRWWNHSDVVNELKDYGINSLYHTQNNEEQGKESHASFYMRRQREMPYHIDYAFLPNDLLHSASIDIGDFEQWIEHSDHMPLIVSIGTNGKHG